MRTQTFAFVALFASACVPLRSDTVDFDITEPFSSVKADVDAGNLQLVAGAEDAATVSFDKHWLARGKPDVGARVEGGVLYIEVDCPLFTSSCSADVVAALPPTAIDALVGSGSIEVEGMLSVDAETGSGDIVVDDVSGRVDAHTGSGDIEVCGVGGNADLETGSGSIFGCWLQGAEVAAETGSGHIELTVEDGFSRVSARTRSGNIQISAPKGRYALDLEAGSGDVDTSGVSNGSGATIEAHTGSGNIEVQGY